MKTKLFLCLVVCSLFLACSEKKAYHNTSLPDPKSFNAHFGDMDTNGDGLVSWDEFKTKNPNAEPKVFAAIDLNADNSLDHDEWHTFKTAHGLKHQD